MLGNPGVEMASCSLKDFYVHVEGVTEIQLEWEMYRCAPQVVSTHYKMYVQL